MAATEDDFQRAVALHRAGRLAEAIPAYRRATKRNPRHAAAFNLLGLALFANREAAPAVAAMQQALTLEPALADGHFNLGLMLRTLGQHEQAAAAFRQAVAAKPDDVRARISLGIELNALEQPALAVEQFELALAREPNNVETLHNLGVALQAQGRSADAIPHYRRALALMPELANAAMNLGNAFNELDRDADALPYYQRALALRPAYAEAHMNMARSLQALGRNAEAAAHFNRAIAARPDWALAKFNKAMFCLSLRQFAEGWELYEQRFAAAPANRPRLYRQPRWDGGPVRTLLVWGEQGLGDQILHAGMIPELAGRAEHVVLEAEARLVPLFARSFAPVQVLALRDELHDGPIDAQIALTSLGRLLRPDAAAFPRREHGYLVPDAGRADVLRQRLHEDARPVVGLSWRSHNPRSGRSKSARLVDFEALLRAPGRRFVDLQYGDTRAEREEIEQTLGISIEHIGEIDNTHDIDGLAALIAACDGVLSVSNTTAHLSGAVGVPTWTLVPHGHARIWYWFKDLTDSPWYPRVRVHRQAPGQSWRDLVASVVPEIAARLER